MVGSVVGGLGGGLGGGGASGDEGERKAAGGSVAAVAGRGGRGGGAGNQRRGSGGLFATPGWQLRRDSALTANTVQHLKSSVPGPIRAYAAGSIGNSNKVLLCYQKKLCTVTPIVAWLRLHRVARAPWRWQRRLRAVFVELPLSGTPLRFSRVVGARNGLERGGRTRHPVWVGGVETGCARGWPRVALGARCGGLRVGYGQLAGGLFCGSTCVLDGYRAHWHRP